MGQFYMLSPTSAPQLYVKGSGPKKGQGIRGRNNYSDFPYYAPQPFSSSGNVLQCAKRLARWKRSNPFFVLKDGPQPPRHILIRGMQAEEVLKKAREEARAK